MDLVRHDSPCIQFIAFIAACAILSSRDARQLADSLPDHFDGLKQLPALQFITGSNAAVVREDKIKDEAPTAYSSILNRILTSVVYRAIPSAAHDRFYTKLVELGAKSVSEKVGNHMGSMVTQKMNKVSCDVSEMMRKGWENWFATLSVISASCAGVWWVQTSSFETILRYTGRCSRRSSLLWLNRMMRKVTTDRVVVLGMGLLGTVAAAAASFNAHNLQLDFEHLSSADVLKGKTGVVALDKNAVTAIAKRETGFSEHALAVNLFESSPPTREQLQQVHAYIRDLLPSNKSPSRSTTITKDALPKCPKEVRDNQLLCMCVMLVTLFAHRIKCRKENYLWLLCVYYARLNNLLKLKQLSN